MKNLTEYIHKFSEQDKGHKTAIIYKTGFRTLKYSYREIYEKSLKVAALLQQEGVKKGDRVIIWAPNSPEWGVFFLGCILNGTIAVPIDVRADKAYLNHVQQQVNAKLVFQTKYRPRYLNIKIIFAENLDISLANCKRLKLKLPEIAESDIVELLYTSGTTSIPKGVTLTHRNIVSNLESVKKVLDITGKYRLLSVLPLSHVFEQTNGFFLPLIAGATIVYLRTIKPSALIETVNKEKITVMLVVPRILSLLEDSIINEFRRKRLYFFFRGLALVAGKMPFFLRKCLFLPLHMKFGGSFEFFGVGGAPFDKERELFWHRLGFLALQGYGLTEASPNVTFNLPHKRRIGSVGTVLPGEQVITGENNEILVRGPNVTQGYYNDREKTRNSFTDGWLKTGDIGTFDKDGFLFLKGRSKDVIITSEGLNVYAEDVEAVLNNMPGIRESAVIGARNKEGEQVHAFLLADLRGKQLADVVTAANKKLMDYQQIQSYDTWPYEDFPRTSTLKVKKNILRQYAEQKNLPESALITQKNRLYSILAKVAQLPIQAITPKSILTTGLHMSSIGRIELVSNIESDFNIDLDETLITNTTTVEELERLIETRKSAKKLGQRDWVRRFPINQLRFLVQHLIIFPALRICCKLKVEGEENLKNLEGPVIFVSNHTSHFDTPLIMTALPMKLRTKLSPAAWGEFHKIRQLPKKYVAFEKALKLLAYNLYSLFANTYLFEQTTRPLQSMQYSGKLIDNGWNLLVFPEGERTDTGKMKPFKQGIGMLAYELRVPVVPLKVEGIFDIFPKGSVIPKKAGKVTVKIGKPIAYGQLRDKSYIEITKAFENAVTRL